MNISPSIAELAKSLVKFQGAVPSIRKNKTVKVPTKKGKEYSYTYATLDHLIETIKPMMNEYGLAFYQSVITEGDRVGVITLLMHESGEFIQSDPLFLPYDTSNPQNAGSSVSYARRYALTSALGLASDEDTDAINNVPGSRNDNRNNNNRGSYRQSYQQERQPAPRQAPPQPSRQQGAQPPAPMQERQPAHNQASHNQERQPVTGTMTIETDGMITKQQLKALGSAVSYHANKNGASVNDVYDTAADACELNGKPSKQLTRHEAARLIDYLNQKTMK